uniref:Uncharacterized protein n=1 Tax=Cucumis melo TaxID=3656 RepID=A0A9I9E8L0_CUCME
MTFLLIDGDPQRFSQPLKGTFRPTTTLFCYMLFGRATHGDLVMQIKRSNFPNHFFFGTSTSFYQDFNFKILCLQIEGGYVEDGRRKKTQFFDLPKKVFVEFGGKIKNNDTGDLTDNHYHRFMIDHQNSACTYVEASPVQTHLVQALLHHNPSLPHHFFQHNFN